MATVRAIQLKTEIPGPRSREILERKSAVVADPLAVYFPVVAAEGRGVSLTDVDGNTFLDFTGGVGCLNVGHAHPRVVDADVDTRRLQERRVVGVDLEAPLVQEAGDRGVGEDHDRDASRLVIVGSWRPRGRSS